METHTAKHFALQLGSLASLYLSLSFLLVLIFSIVNLSFPDATDSIWQIESYSSSARLGIAMVIVFFPTYLILTRFVNTSRRKSTSNSYLTLTKWLIYLSLLVGGAVLLGDLVAVILAFLEGDITTRFILKSLAVLVVVGAAFSYYLLDAREYWITHERQSIVFGGVALAVVLIAVVFGFMNIEAPAEVRERKLDATQVQDLQNIQWRIQEYLLLNERLPESIAEVFVAVPQPEAPENRPAYRYELTDDGFQLCATFSTESRTDEFYYHNRPMMAPVEKSGILNPDNWEHGTGEVCFERKVQFAE
jgi:hypothetical protein